MPKEKQVKEPTDDQVEEIWKTLKFDQGQIFRNPDEMAKHLRGELVRAALASRPDALSVAELAMIREQAAAETDDWAERQAKEPTKEECDAMFVRKVLALSRPDAQADERREFAWFIQTDDLVEFYSWTKPADRPDAFPLARAAAPQAEAAQLRLSPCITDTDPDMRKAADEVPDFFTAPSLDREQVECLHAACSAPTICGRLTKCQFVDREQAGEALAENTEQQPMPMMDFGESGLVAEMLEALEAVVSVADRATIEFDKARAAIERARTALNAGASPSRERGEQECPHGVDDGACKQCYGEAVSGGRQGCRMPTGDELRAAARSVGSLGTNHGDASHEYVVAGWKACMDACKAASVSTPITVLDDEVLQHARDMVKGHYPNHREYKVANALLAASAPTLGAENVAEAAACIADSFTCGTCGMDGKAGARIREILGDPMGSVTVRHGLAPQPQAAEPKGMADEQIESLAHRQAHRYRHGPDSIEFIFNRECLLNFARALLAKGE